MFVCTFRVLNGVAMLQSTLTVEDIEEARAQAARKAGRAAENGWALQEAMSGVWLGGDREGNSVAIIVGSKPLALRDKEDRAKARRKERVGRLAD